MTYEEASKNINFIIKCLNKRRMAPCGFCKSDKCVPNPHECTKDDFVIDKAIEALEKQIPKKVIWKHFDSSGDPLPLPYCSTCGRSVMRSDYCDNCGQRLDWSEEE